MSERKDYLFLLDIVEAGQKIIRYTSDVDYDDFVETDLIIDGVARNFEVIGEAANRISNELKKEYPNIQWIRLADFRNRIIHEYFGLDYEIMWAIIQENVEDLIDDVQNIINRIESD